MQRLDGRIVLSPTDLAEFLSSRFASWMSRGALDHPEWRPGRDASDPEALPDTGEILKRRGFEHEARELERLQAEGRDVVAFAQNEAGARDRTLAAMRAGRGVIAQAHLAGDRFAGIADFLVRVPGASALGDFHYEVWDAKLARHPKPTHLLQLCCYVDLLEAIQGVRPAEVQLALGDGTHRRFRTDDHFYFYHALRDAFVRSVDAWSEQSPPLPDPAADHGRWQEEAERRLEMSDHPSRVAFCTGAQTRKLAGAGIATASALADTTRSHVTGLDDRVFARLREQARLQRDSAGREVPLHRVLGEDEVEAGRGFAMLPPASPGDVCFDLEGDPLEVGGLEYLWGVIFRDEGGALAYRDWWAHDRAEERVALESFLDWLTVRREKYPDLHVYHYASYETAVLKRLAGREGTREDALDVLLREQVFVDLYGVVRHGLRVGEPRYSLKNVERLYRGARAGEVTSGMQSVVVYDAWRHAGEPRAWSESKLLRQIRDYNEEDCRSTAELLEWLHARQAEAGLGFRELIRDEETKEPTERQEQRSARQALAERMLAALPPAEVRQRETERWEAHELLAQLLEFHRREARPVWWDVHDRAGKTVEERLELADCLAGLERTTTPPSELTAQSDGYEYRYDVSQDSKVVRGKSYQVAQYPYLSVVLETLDPEAGRAVLKVTRKKLARFGLEALPDRVCLIECNTVDTDGIEASLAAIAGEFLAHTHLEPAAWDLLLRRSPRIRDHEGPSIRRTGEPIGDALLRAVRGLDDSVLCVQGPPGSGKTTECAKVIVALLDDGMRVGITSNSHSAIDNLMRRCLDIDAGIPSIRVIRKPRKEDIPGALYVDDGGGVVRWLGERRLVGGTAWCFSHADLTSRLDYLFIDEASQVSLANAVAMSRSTRNLVLVGDQMQLSQPTRAIHPGRSGESALDSMLGDQITIPADRGLFLETTYRLHPKICHFISGAFYENRLQPAPANAKRSVEGIAPGLHFVSVAHEGNTQGSDEEVEAIGKLVGDLVGRTFRDADGEEKPLTLDDVLVVAPYNLQVRKLAEKLPAGSRIGSVDRFQGLQAPVVIVSMCASEPHLSPRGIDFLFHPNRLNVAVSRAQCAAFVVASPKLATAACRSVEEMRLVNRVCRMLDETVDGPVTQR